jgi:hypothetical protein
MVIENSRSLRKLITDLDSVLDEEIELTSLLNEYLRLQEEGIAETKPFRRKEEFERDFLASFPYLSRSSLKSVKSLLFQSVKPIDDLSFVLDNPYYACLSGLSISEGPIGLKMKDVPSGRLFPYSSYSQGPAPFYMEMPSFAYSSKSFSYPVFEKDGRPWMSLVPHEISTMEEAIKKSHGEVLTYGLGMGYFAFSCCQKENVKRVTVIESDEEIIAFFNAHLLPFFPKGKLHIEKADALEFARRHRDHAYDYLFADIYHDAEDGLPLYIALKQNEGAAKTSDYWIEGDLLVYLRRYVIAYLNEQLDPEILAFGDRQYKESKSAESKIYALVHKSLKNVVLKDESYLSSLLSDSSLKKIILGTI